MDGVFRQEGVVKTVWMLVVALTTVTACRSPDHPAVTVPDAGGPGSEKALQVREIEQQMGAAYDEIVRLIAGAACDTDTQCGILEVGAKPCGGPWEFLAYANANTDLARLFQTAEVYRQLNIELNTVNELVSDCAMVLPPPVACRDYVCTILPVQGGTTLTLQPTASAGYSGSSRSAKLSASPG